jgi:predicted PurR-regulated permease PerM
MQHADIKTRLSRSFLLFLLFAVSGLFLAVVWLFLKPLILAALLAALFYPFYGWITRVFRGRRALSAVVTLVILFILVVGPLSAFVSLVVNQAVVLSNEALPWLQQHFGAATNFNVHDWLARQFPALADYIPPQEQIVESVGAAAKSAGGYLVGVISRMTAGTATFVLNLFVMLYAMFFFFKDGRQMIETILCYIPLSRDAKTRMLTQFTSISRATLKGTLMIGIIQGVLDGVAFWLAGIDGAALWGTLMAFLSILPAVGAPLVWVPAGLYLLLSGRVVAGLILVGWCAAVLATLEYIVRPALVGTDAKLPDILILIGTLGGLYLFGPIGFIIGPIVCGLFLTVWQIYGESFGAPASEKEGDRRDSPR